MRIKQCLSGEKHIKSPSFPPDSISNIFSNNFRNIGARIYRAFSSLLKNCTFHICWQRRVPVAYKELLEGTNINAGLKLIWSFDAIKQMVHLFPLMNTGGGIMFHLRFISLKTFNKPPHVHFHPSVFMCIFDFHIKWKKNCGNANKRGKGLLFQRNWLLRWKRWHVKKEKMEPIFSSFSHPNNPWCGVPTAAFFFYCRQAHYSSPNNWMQPQQQRVQQIKVSGPIVTETPLHVAPASELLPMIKAKLHQSFQVKFSLLVMRNATQPVGMSLCTTGLWKSTYFSLYCFVSTFRSV